MADASAAEVAIVGAGAAGLTAAIFAAESSRAAGRQHASIVLLEGAKRVGAKILISGGGRCNVTHEMVRTDDFNFSGSPNVVRNILRAFDEQAAVRWFESLGVPLKREATGKLFPVSNRARDVVDALLRRCDELGVKLLTGHRVEAVSRQGQEFLIRHAQGDLAARRVVLATGGRSVPHTGSDGHGWEIARALGHTVTPTYPALSPLVLDPSFFHTRLSGVSHDVELTTLVDGRPIDRRSGALLWTHFGCSGPVVLDASRFWIIAQAQGRQPELRCNVLASSRHTPCAVERSSFHSRSLEQERKDDTDERNEFRSTSEIDRWLVETAAHEPRRTLAGALADVLPHRLAGEIVALAGRSPEQPLAQLTKEQRKQLARHLTELRLPVVRDRGWNYAEVTAGGVPLGEIDYRTMQSRIVPGLYVIGEMLDCEGRIGGFNFQWAWATGHVAGKALARAK
jgi:predicted Rossmann fold flavoprotein